MQALYQWQLTQQPSSDIAGQFIGGEEMKGADVEYFTELLTQCAQQSATIDATLAGFLDRPAGQLDPVEHAILLIGIYELSNRLDVPYRVVINEGVELSKRFGATDGHKYINGVLDKAARAIRADERQS